MKEYVKKPPAKKSLVITQAEAFDLCYSKGKKDADKTIDIFTQFKTFIKDAEKQIKEVEKEKKKKPIASKKVIIDDTVDDKKVAKKSKGEKEEKEEKGEKECPPDKILNPATKRCVLKTSAIGKKILASKN